MWDAGHDSSCGHPEVDLELLVTFMEVIQALDGLIQYQADIYGHDAAKRRQFLNFTTPTMCKNNQFWNIVYCHVSPIDLKLFVNWLGYPLNIFIMHHKINYLTFTKYAKSNFLVLRLF